MVKDVKGITRVIFGYSKIPDDNDEYPLEVEYELRPIDIAFLRQWFNIKSNESEPIIFDLIGPIEIKTEQAEKLEPYLVSGKFELEKYDFYLDTYQTPGYEEYWKTPHALEYEEK